jgi:hypothetical protein
MISKTADLFFQLDLEEIKEEEFITQARSEYLNLQQCKVDALKARQSVYITTLAMLVGTAVTLFASIGLAVSIAVSCEHGRQAGANHPNQAHIDSIRYQDVLDNH